jgi:hypothetical protein
LTKSSGGRRTFDRRRKRKSYLIIKISVKSVGEEVKLFFVLVVQWLFIWDGAQALLVPKTLPAALITFVPSVESPRQM